MFDFFQIQINIAVFNISLNILSKAWLIVFLVNKLSGFINTKVFFKKIVVIAVNELYSNNFRQKR